jgi:hypothetical protein
MYVLIKDNRTEQKNENDHIIRLKLARGLERGP